jgi:hypothetical protein
MENEQINQESNDSVETPRDAVDVFTEILEAESSDNDKNETTNEKQENVEKNAEEAEEENESEEEVEEESEEDEPDDTDEDDEDSDEDESEVEEVKTYKVKANGQEQEVTLDELVSGFQKGSDYTKKSQELAAQKQAVQQEAHAIQEAMQLREEYSHRLSQVEQLLQNQGDDGVDMAELKENDPIAWSIKTAEKTENNKKLQLLQQEQDKLAYAQSQQVSQHQAKVVAHEAQMLSEKIKEFSDEKSSEQVKKDIRNFGKSIGFTDQELAQVYDHRHVMVMHKAAQWDKLQKANPSVTKKLAKAPKMSKKGNKVANSSLITKQKKRLQSSGSIEDATELFKNFL